ncbi:hypothetical protein KJ693_06300 [bacterium]|nr:hypothetical protein [bacterium]
MGKERKAVKELIVENYLLNEYFTVFLFEDLSAKSKSTEEIYLEEVNDSDIYWHIRKRIRKNRERWTISNRKRIS